ncbi:MAG: hypothetical protein NTY02_07855 [Acidobacteria bacterium]|nr:hypothetical protein [Acidobacteriota bacterium]
MNAFSASLGDYWHRPVDLVAWTTILPVGEGERMLFPGVLTVAIAALAIASLNPNSWSARLPRPKTWAWHVGLYAGVLALAVWCTFGPGVVGPYRVMLRILPGMDGLRVPARFIVVVSMALAVLAAGGAAWLLTRLTPRVAASVALVLCAALVVEGYGGRLTMCAFSPAQQPRQALNAWLRASPPGAVVELPISGPELAPFTLEYQLSTLAHGHPIVNGYSGYGYGLQDFLGGPASPLAYTDELPHTLRGLRQLGVRYVVVHPSRFEKRPGFRWTDAGPVVEAIDRAADQVEERRTLGEAIAWRLADIRVPPVFDEGAWKKIESGSLTVSASAMPDRVKYATDGDVLTRWFSNAPQRGTEWVRIAFDGEKDLAALRIQASRERTGDYPRWLLVESESEDGSKTTMFDDSVVAQLIVGMVRDGRTSPIVIPLPPNRTRVLWLHQRGHTRTWHGSVPELTFWERTPAAR